jgi:flagellar biosynthesis/type III secretory pathway protein FliH
MFEREGFVILTLAQIRELLAEVDQVEEGAYDAGYEDGHAQGYDAGYNEGAADSYDDGYTDGFEDGASYARAEAEFRAAEKAAYFDPRLEQ